MKKVIFCGALLVAVLITACGKKDGMWYSKNWETEHPNGQTNGPAAPCDTSAVVSYSATVQPIITSNCATTSSCHVAHGGALNYNVFANVVTDCNTSANGFMARLDLSTTNSLHMPKDGGFLVACDTMKIRKWINAGCPNN